MCCSTQASSAALVLLLLLGHQSLAMAPGDEDDVCGVPEYPVYFRVLMDSWRYRRLLPPEGGGSSTAAPWTTNRDWSSQGECDSSSVSLCAGGPRENKSIQTQFINKSLPAPDTYPVKIFVDVTYNFTNCGMAQCDSGDIELLVSHADSDQYTGDGITPNNVIFFSTRIPSGTRQFSFLSNNTSSGFSISLQATEACVAVSRVLVYRYECAGHDRLPTGLSRRPPTQAADSGTVRVIPYCADHSHFSAANGQNTLVCLSNGTWLNEQPQCECDEGYKEDVDTCKAIGIVDSVTTTTSTVPGHRGTEIYSTSSSRPTSLPLSYPAQYISPSSTPLAGGSTDRPTVAAEDSGGSGPLLPIVAGVCGFILVLILVVVVLIVALLRKNRKTGPEESKADLCTTTENVAYVSTVKPVVRPSGQSPVYEEIHSDALGTGGAGENQVYEEIHSDAVRTSGGDDIGTTENVAYATSTRRPATDSIHSIHKFETAEFEPKTRDEETD